MAAPEASGGPAGRRGKGRRIWRVCRLGVLCALLGLVMGLLYLNRVGLPEVLRRPLLERLRARGLVLEVARLRLSAHRGLVAERVRLGRESPAEAGGGRDSGVQLSARSADVQLRWSALLRGRVEVAGLVLREGRLVAALSEPGRAPRELALEELEGAVRFLPGDEWVLEDFRARLAGVRLNVTGILTNATALRRGAARRDQADWRRFEQHCRRLSETLEQMQFVAEPQLRLMLRGDVRDLRTFTLRLTLELPQARTPWADWEGAQLALHILPVAQHRAHQARARLEALSARTRWASVTNLELSFWLSTSGSDTNRLDGTLQAAAARVRTPWGELLRPRFEAHWLQAVTNPVPISGQGRLLAGALSSPWLAGEDLHFEAKLRPATTPAGPLVAAVGPGSWWTNLAPYALDWTGELARPDPTAATGLGAEQVMLSGRWRAPELALTHLRVAFPEGALEGQVTLNATNRVLEGELRSDFDLQRLLPWLPERTRERLGRFCWAVPPRLNVHGRATLPVRTNGLADWQAQLQSGAWLAGEFELVDAAYLGLPVQRASGRFFYTNQVWWLPELKLWRPEGALTLAHRSSDATREFFWQLEGVFDPRLLRPWLKPGAAEDLDLLECAQPASVSGRVRGRWRAPQELGFEGRLALTNFSVRGEHADWFESTLRYTNGVLELLGPRLGRGAERLEAEGMCVDWPGDRIWFTNGLSTADPMVVARAIGPKVAAAVAPYRFGAPPRVRVNGYAPLHGSENADVRFEIEGGLLSWWKLQATQLTGTVRWRGLRVSLTNVEMDIYGGRAAGEAELDFGPARGAVFAMRAGVTNAALARLLADVSARTNRLEGELSGWVVMHGRTDDPRSWTGQGRARLRDGFLWELPIFGVLSGPLDVLLPGVANSCFTDASARFTLTNGLIVWDKLEMRAPALRLQYEGTVDWDGRVEMRVEAEPLRDAPLVGRVLGLAFWPVSKLFQYRIQGTLAEPKTEPTYVPKWFLFPLRPLRTLEEMFSRPPAATNAPARPPE